MILRINELQEKCKIILNAVDSNSFSLLTDTLELISKNGTLEMNVTNKEYFVSVKLPVNEEDSIKATVNASLFLKLISKITTDTVELKTEKTNLIIIGNGRYKIPLIYEGENILELPRIDINNVTINFNINGDILTGINKYNTRQWAVGIISKPVQKLCYVDEQGAITFTSGACVNKFTLEKSVKMLLNSKLVKMFNLFRGLTVDFSMGYDTIAEDIIQTKVRFKTDNIDITAILSCDDSLLSSVPVTAIRGRAFNTYDNSIVINRNELLQTIDRLMLFPSTDNNKLYSKFEFSSEYVKIYDSSNENDEMIYYDKKVGMSSDYTTILDLNDIKTVIDGFTEQFITLNFGDNQAVVVSVGNIYNVIPEVVVS